MFIILESDRLVAYQTSYILKIDVVISLDRNPKAIFELDGVMTVVDNRSAKLFNREPSIELSDWTEAYQWSFENTYFLK